MVSASFFEVIRNAPNLSNGGLHLPYTEDGSGPLQPPMTFSAYKSATLGDSGDGRPTGPAKSVMKLHVNSAHASAQQWRRVLVDSDEENIH